jgi:hypothetical protein
MKAKPKGKPKTPPTAEERQQVTTMAAAGLSQAAIARNLDRSRHMVRNVLAQPEIQRSIQDEKAELAQLYREKARTIVESISSADIADASLQQKAVSTGILLDKSLLLSGDPTSINVSVLMDLVDALRSRPQGSVVLPIQSPSLPQPEP